MKTRKWLFFAFTSLIILPAKRDAAWIRLYLKDPMAALPEAKMPKVDLTDQEIADLTAFLRLR
ncbi:c-type cytochrome [Thiocystis minor]|uniref:c-type cytochrome n=1 Tax=Thiocystis minor TaxID=61597 RepID=UPI001F5D1761|nr:hypothetical protein [Thiocystis minor]